MAGGNQEQGDELQFGIYILLKPFLCEFMLLIGLNGRLLQRTVALL